MIKNYFKIFLRGLLKNKSYGVLNIFGLAIGITCAALIFLWVEDEVGFDKEFANREQIYKVLTNQNYNGEIYTMDATPGPLADVIKTEIPGIRFSTHYNDETHLLTVKDKPLYKHGAFVDSDFYKMFGLTFMEGSYHNIKDNPNGIVLTNKTAKELFGTTNVIGKHVKMDNDQSFTVAGVIEDLPENVSLYFDWLAPFSNYKVGKEYFSYWGSNSTSTMIQLADNANISNIKKEVKEIIPNNNDNDGRVYGILFSMKDWHLRWDFENGVHQSGGRIIYVRLLSLIALIILITACINFTNLATARSINRASEVGMRKVLGSSRIALMGQFFLEAFFLTIMACILSAIAIWLILPSFNILINKELLLNFTSPKHYLALVVIILFCSLLSGFYPAVYLSSFRPVLILKGIYGKQRGSNIIRNGLVVLQFATSVVLIVGAIIIYNQIQFVKERDVGFNKSNLLAIQLRGDAVKKIETIKNEMLQTGFIQDLGLNSFDLMSFGYNGGGWMWEGKPEDFDPLISFRFIDNNFIPTTQMTVTEGRNFYKTPNQNKTEIIITSSLAKMMETDDVVGKLIRRDDEVFEIVGVVKDYVFGSIYSKKSDPVIFFNEPKRAELLYARVKENMPLDKVTQALSSVMTSYNPEFPFEFTYVEDTFNGKFRNEKLIEKLSQYFSLIVVLISCFGLFGLAAYTAEQRNKEIGVRKVLGAKVGSIMALLSSDFLKLMGIATVIAIPIAFYLLQNWLNGFPYRVSISWWMFLLGACIPLVVALITVGYQALKAAVANPIKSLRSE